jgi:hypothetical protein
MLPRSLQEPSIVPSAPSGPFAPLEQPSVRKALHRI